MHYGSQNIHCERRTLPMRKTGCQKIFSVLITKSYLILIPYSFF